jgi:tetratricopeptide (TPR) repeat protein
MAEFLGWLNQDLGDFTQATYWSDRAMEWAQETGDEVLAAYVLFRKANQATARRNAQQAVSLARAAQRAPGVTASIRALAMQQEAQGHALLGNPRFAMTKFDEARELAAVAGADAPSEDTALDTSYCTPVYVEMQRANCLIEFGEPLRAAEAFEAELRILPQVYRTDHGVYLSRLARAYATAGEPEQSAEAATRALTIALDTESARAMGELSAAERALSAWATVPEVAAFTARFTLARGVTAYGSRTGP